MQTRCFLNSEKQKNENYNWKTADYKSNANQTQYDILYSSAPELLVALLLLQLALWVLYLHFQSHVIPKKIYINGIETVQIKRNRLIRNHPRRSADWNKIRGKLQKHREPDSARQGRPGDDASANEAPVFDCAHLPYLFRNRPRPTEGPEREQPCR